MVLAVAASIALATWQFGVWQDNRKAQEHDVSGLPPIALSDVISPAEGYPGDAIGRQVTLDGTWMPQETFFVEAKPGYWVVTLVKVGDYAMPVIRGWSATATAPSVGAQSVHVGGWLEPSNDTSPVEVSAGIWGSLSVVALAQDASLPLYAAYVVADDAGSGLDGLQQRGPTETSSTGADWGTGLRNFLYGVQWWLFAAFSVYLWWKWCRDQRRPVTDEPVASGAS